MKKINPLDNIDTVIHQAGGIAIADQNKGGYKVPEKGLMFKEYNFDNLCLELGWVTHEKMRGL